MTIVGWLIYEEQDAKLNTTFIDMLINAAKQQHIDLQLKIMEHFDFGTFNESPAFIWNRSRDFQLADFFEQQGILVLNNSTVNKIANNKLLAQDLAKRLHIPHIPTWTALPPSIELPIVAKSLDGHGGKEVVLCENMEQAQLFLQKHPNKAIFQPFIRSNSQDIRVWMLGDTILGAVKRTGQNSFKSNYTLGGHIEKYKPDNELTSYIHKLTDHLQSDYIGIDFLLGEDGHYYFNEIEDPVGARSYFDLYSHHLPEILVQYIKNKVE